MIYVQNMLNFPCEDEIKIAQSHLEKLQDSSIPILTNINGKLKINF